MKSALLNSPLHCFLIIIFFILHVVNSYFGLMPVIPVVRYLGYYLFIGIILFLFGKLIFHSTLRAGIWVTMVLAVYFFFGALHDFLGPQRVPYRVILPALLAGIIIASILLKKQRAEPVRFNTYLNLLFTILAGLDILLIVFKTLSNHSAKNNLSRTSTVWNSRPNLESQDPPDIFFIVFDEYASSKSLKKYLKFENRWLDSSLQANNFFIATNSKSNYNATPFSLAATLNLDYFKQPLSYEKTIPILRLQAFHTLKKSIVPAELRKKGYEIFNFALNDLNDKPVLTKEFSKPTIIQALSGETLVGRIQRDIWWNAVRFLKIKARPDRNIEIINTINYNATLKQLGTQSDTPKFVFVHLMMPHRPFNFDSAGKRRDISQDVSTKNDDSLYLNYLIYTNKLITKLAEAANRPFPRPRAVVIESDHGYRDLHINEHTIFEKEFMNLNTYYFSDKNYIILYDSISPVNSFRAIFNKYFNSELKLLKDSSIIMD